MSNKPISHIHANEIKAWADGAKIEYWSLLTKSWLEAHSPNWNEDVKYRIKPEPKPDVISNVIMSFKHDWKRAQIHCQWEGVICPAGYVHNLDQDVHYFKFIFDSEAGNLKSVEFVK